MHTSTSRARCRPLACCAAWIVLVSAAAGAQQAPAEDEARTTGLPAGVDWRFNIDAAWGNFGFMNSLYTNPKPGEPSGDLGDNWFEGSVKPALTGSYKTASTWTLWGKASVVGERTYGAAPTAVGEDASSFKAEDLAFGVRSGKALGTLGDDAIELTVGRAQYQLGHGFLLWDGAAEGGSRGGYWSNARRAFAFASIARVKTGAHKVESFYLRRDELPEADVDTRLAGANYEFSPAETTTIGATYMRFWANEQNPGRNGLDVFNLRAYTSPIASLEALAFEAEYAREKNGALLESRAWTAQAAYEFADATWKPKVSYRYASFQGDDPATSQNEAWDALLPGFYDWGSWWQGEIAGEYLRGKHQPRIPRSAPSRRANRDDRHGTHWLEVPGGPARVGG